MFSVADRAALRERLVAAAQADPAVTAAALVGSAARDAEDAWSDIDLALRLVDGASVTEVADRWCVVVGGVASLDMWSGTALYRVFLLADTLQVDVSFWPSASFGAVGRAPFRVLFGTANAPQPAKPRDRAAVIGMGWLYALHARSSIARDRPLQATYMLNGLREEIGSLMCLRHDLPDREGRGLDDLPGSERSVLAACVPRGLDRADLVAALATSVDALLSEAAYVDTATADLTEVLHQLVSSVAGPR